MTNHELATLRRLVSIGTDIAIAMRAYPNWTVAQVAGSATEKGDPLYEFCKALDAATRIIFEINGDTDALAYLDAQQALRGT